MEYITGLTTEEAKKRAIEGKINYVNRDYSKSYFRIVSDNVFTFFNFLNIILFVLVLFAKSIRNGFFIGVIFFNTVLKIYQEIKTKKILSELNIVTMEKTNVLRDGQNTKIETKDIVLGDVVRVETGSQIPCDGKVVLGEIEVNESIVTGESNLIKKREGDTLLSGSLVISGKALYKTTAVGVDNYAEKISAQAKSRKKVNSELKNSINKILKYISIIILPLGLGLFLKLFFISKISFNEAILSTVSSVVGMIPEGLVLLTTITLSAGVIKLAKKKTLVQEIYCIETLARINSICVDKTGTLTSGELKVEKVISVGSEDLNLVIGNLMNAFESTNATSKAFLDYFEKDVTLNPLNVIEFSSERKYSGVAFENVGTYYMGAYQYLFKNKEKKLDDSYRKYTALGYRVIVLAKSKIVVRSDELPDDLEAIGLVIISDRLRDGVEETISYFYKQGINIKVISGDDPLTVKFVAALAGIKNADDFMDMSKVNDAVDYKKISQKYTVFGRVKPEQKKKLIAAMQENENIVAMVGDGVNDVPALKQSDCSVSMASGSDATKKTANIVLLDNDFNNMPKVFTQGRTVINNIEKSATMFLIKTGFSMILALLVLCFGDVYPFKPIQLTLISALCVAVPSFFLNFEKNDKPFKKAFLKNVFSKSIPYSVAIVLISFLSTFLGDKFGYSVEQSSMITVITTAILYFYALIELNLPFNKYRKAIILGCVTIFAVVLTIFHKFFFVEFVGVWFLWISLIVAAFFIVGIIFVKHFIKRKMN